MPRIIELHPGESVTLPDGTVIRAVQALCDESNDCVAVGLRNIRERLGLSQSELGTIMGCVQGNVTAYERDTNPRPIPHWRAAKVIEYARGKGLAISFDHIYGDAALPVARQASTAGA